MPNQPRRQAIHGPLIATRGRLAPASAVLVTDGVIDAVVRSEEVPSEYETRFVGRGILAPGFIDVHTHGAAGRSFNEADATAHRTALGALLGSGVTTALPTITAAPLAEMLAAVEVSTELTSDGDTPRTPGVHLEGPYFALAQRGAQDQAALRLPDRESVAQILEYHDSIRIMSFAPELPGSVALTERLVDVGIVAAAGHSDARGSDLMACRRAGLSHIIHIVSGQSRTTRDGPWRRPGLFEATLASDDLTVEMIADGMHLPPLLMRLAYRCLAGRLCVVSDSTPGSGLPDGSLYRLGGGEFVVEDGVGMTLDRSAFAGSTTLVPAMLPILVAVLDISIPEAIAMATEVPARAARLTDVGRIAPGCHADFVLLDESLNVTNVAIAGRWRTPATDHAAGLDTATPVPKE